MKILSSIQLGKPQSATPSCRRCAHFQNDPATIEATYPGLNSMSSGFASVRDQDGLCNFHQLYLSARDSCPQFLVSPQDCSGTPLSHHPDAIPG